MKIILAIMLLLAASAGPSVAQTQTDAATKDDVQQFISLMNLHQQMELLITGMMQQATATVVDRYKSAHPNATAAEIAKTEEAAAGAAQIAIKNFPVDELIEAMVPIYQRHLTHSDMKNVIEFYSSPTGQKFIHEAPVMMKEGMQAGNAVMQKHLPEIKAQIEKAAEEAPQNGTAAVSSGSAGTNDAPPAGAERKIQIPEGTSQGLLISRVDPVYPPLARQARIQGTVILSAVIGKDGSVESLTLVSGPPMLVQSAMDAVKQWRYKPYVVNGETVKVSTHVNVNFVLE